MLQPCKRSPSSDCTFFESYELSTLIHYFVYAFTVAYDYAILKIARVVATETDHPPSTFFHVFPSQRRYRCIKCKTSRYSRGFVPVAIRMLNAKWVILLSTDWIVLVVDTSGNSLAFLLWPSYIFYMWSWVVQCISFLRTIKWNWLIDEHHIQAEGWTQDHLDASSFRTLAYDWFHHHEVSGCEWYPQYPSHAWN